MRKSVDLVKQKAGTPEADANAGAAGDDDVLEAIHSVMHLFRSRQHRALRGGAHELTHLESRVLGFFARNPGATQSDLAAHSGRDKGQLARLIASLRQQGLLEARADEADRRSLLIEPTAEGGKVHQALQRQARRLAEQAAASLSADERRRLVALLRKVQDGLEGAP